MTDAPALPAAGATPGGPLPMPRPAGSDWRWWLGLAGVLFVLAVAALLLALTTQQRLRHLEQELVRRQQDSQGQAAEALVLARQAQDAARDASAKVALLEARVAESSLQRSEVEELIQSLSRSRDENVVADVEAGVRVALQQSEITGSAEPLVATLKAADERLARYNQPRLERVRRALTHDLERLRSVGVADISSLTIRLDEAVRLVDDLPLLATAELRHGGREGMAADSDPPTGAPPGAAADKPSAALLAGPGWQQTLTAGWQTLSSRVWDEVRALVRVTRIDHPEAVLASPEQSFFVRENLKLRLLNARLALLSRQFETVQTDLRDVQATLERYFDRRAKRVAAMLDLLRQVAAQARQNGLPRPDETLAALAAAGIGK